MPSQEAKRQCVSLNEEVNQERGRMEIRKHERGKGNSQDDSKGSARTTAVQQTKKVTTAKAEQKPEGGRPRGRPGTGVSS